MSKIAIISQPDQGVLIDVGGCSNMQEAISHLSNTLQVSSQFWKGVNVALNLGDLELSNQQVAHILALAKGVGVYPRQVYSQQMMTRQALMEHNVILGEGTPMTLPAMTLKVPDPEVYFEEEFEEEIPPQVEEEVSGLFETQEVFSDVEESLQGIDPSIYLEIEETPASVFEAKKAPIPVPVKAPPVVLFLKQTLRSGQTVSHKGHLVIIGDVNPGAEIMAEGDITVWGALRGIAHAGVGGNTLSEIRALKLQPIQIRIANAIARSPDRQKAHYESGAGPETARVVDGKIKVFRFNLS